MVLVIGGRSKIGSAVIEGLREKGEPVRALARAAENGAVPEGVEPAPGDLADIVSIARAMDGVDRMFLLCGPTRDEYWLNRNAIDAAEGADVRLLVRSSILGADPEATSTFARDHGTCDEYLRDSLLHSTVLRPNLFLQNIPESTIPAIDDNGRFYVNAGEARISMVDTRDVAAVAVAALTESGHEGQQYDVTGPEALSYAEVANLLSEHQRRSITYVATDDQATRAALLGAGLDEWLAGALVELYQDYRRSGSDGHAAQVSDTVKRVTGRTPRSLRALLAELPASARA